MYANQLCEVSKVNPIRTRGKNMVSHIDKVTVTLKVTSFSVKFVGFFFFMIVSFFYLVFFLNEEMFIQ